MELLQPNGDLLNGNGSIHQLVTRYKYICPMNYVVSFARLEKSLRISKIENNKLHEIFPFFCCFSLHKTPCLIQLLAEKGQLEISLISGLYISI